MAGYTTHGELTHGHSSGYPRRIEAVYGGHETVLSFIPMSPRSISLALLTVRTGQSAVWMPFEAFAYIVSPSYISDLNCVLIRFLALCRIEWDSLDDCKTIK